MAGSINIPADILAELHAQALDDPQLPRDQPTTSFWQLPPHPTLSNIQSSQLPSTTDVAIIGSGVTGCAVAKTLLDSQPSPSSGARSITVLEARLLTSGATGRNGGLLTSFVPGDFTHLSDQFGREQAIKIARFANRTLEKMHSLCNSTEELKDASQVRRLLDVIAYEDEEAFSESKAAFLLYEECVPEDRGKTQFLSAEEAASKYNMKAKGGAIVYPNGAFWPYRLITRIWASLLTLYPTQLSIETSTPVTQISHDPSTSATHPYILHTHRGTIRAARIVHATNGYSGHLLPELRGKIFPLRGTMSTQVATPEFGSHGRELSWSLVGRGKLDEETNVLELGLYYSNQNPTTGDIFIGGERAKINEILISDDTRVGEPCRENISTILPRLFHNGWKQGQNPEVRKIWSGIMGFTSDRLPLVGSLPEGITNRGREGGEWIAAGFNGYGMPLCWSSGEAVARMILGEDVSDFLPEVFLVSQDRLDDAKRMAPMPAVERLFSGQV